MVEYKPTAHWVNSKLTGVTVSPQIALLISGLIHPPKVKYSLITINKNISASRTNTPSQREIFSEIGTGTSSSEDVTHSDRDMSEEATDPMGSESSSEETSMETSHSRTTTPSQSKIFSYYNANSQSSSRETLRPSSPESGNLTTRTLCSPLPEMAIVNRTMHDAIHTVREQQGRAVTRSLLSQQKALAANKLQCNVQIKRTSTLDPPSVSNVPPRRARARS